MKSSPANYIPPSEQVSMSSSRSPWITKGRLPPLTRQFFSEMMKLETDFYNKDYTIETLNELSQYYGVSSSELLLLIRIIECSRIL